MISDNGSQSVAREFEEYIRPCGMAHVRTSPRYPRGNGKVERYHKSLKSVRVRPTAPLSLENARRVVKKYVDYYNSRRLHGTIGHIAPNGGLEGRGEAVRAWRRRELAEAHERRAVVVGHKTALMLIRELARFFSPVCPVRPHWF